MPSSMLIIDLPPEIIEEILVYCDPIEIAQAAKSCSALRSIVYLSDDSKLWRELYLMQPFDDPRKAVSRMGLPRPSPIPWRTELQQIIRARTVVTAEDSVATLRPGELESILGIFLHMICFVRPLKSQNDVDVEHLSRNLVWVTAMLQHRFLDDLEERRGWNTEETQLIARLQAYFGLTSAGRSRERRVKSRAYVYNMWNYRPENEYGPLLPDGEVNWEHMQALHHIVSMQMLDLANLLESDLPVLPMSLPFTQVVVPSEPDEDERNDWAGVTGSWMVSFCYCDHRDLLAYNVGDPNNLDTSLFEHPEFREEYRSLAVELSIRRVQSDPNHPDNPIIYFYGQMNAPSTSMMTGHVKMTKDNQVQWHFVSGEQGNAIWSCEGIQVGGLRSRYGILGAWTTISHDLDDPVGPFWLRKNAFRRRTDIR